MDEKLLIKQSLKGNHQSFQRLVIRYEEKLMRFLRVRCDNHSDADDIFQETFLNAHRYLSSYNFKFAFSTWLFNIAINAIHRFYRLNIDHEPIESATIEQRPNNTNIWPIARKQLSTEQFEILWLTYAEGYTGKEVSAIVEKSLPWVKINLVRAKEQLRTLMERDQLSVADWVS